MEKLKGQAEAFCRKYLQCMDPDQAAAMAGCADGYAVLETKMAVSYTHLVLTGMGVVLG